MKILVVSDSHGDERNIERMLQIEKKADLMLHLGDVCGSESHIESICNFPVKMIAGNNDWYSNLPNEERLTIMGKKIWMTHGHDYGVYYDYEDLYQKALEQHIDIVMFGHVHRPVFEQRAGVTLINPGSISLPRQKDRRCSYMVITVDAGRNFDFKICYI